MAWQDNVKNAISKEASAAWATAGNKIGGKHKPYRISDLAEAMGIAAGMHGTSRYG